MHISDFWISRLSNHTSSFNSYLIFLWVRKCSLTHMSMTHLSFLVWNHWMVIGLKNSKSYNIKRFQVLLPMLIDENLNWDGHIQKVLKKLALEYMLCSYYIVPFVQCLNLENDIFFVHPLPYNTWHLPIRAS